MEIPEYITELAEEYAARQPSIKEARSWAWKTERELKAAVRTYGPIPLSSGERLLIDAKGYDYDNDGIAAELPGLVAAIRLAFTIGPSNGTTAHQRAERALSLILEELGNDTEYALDRVLDKKAAAEVQRQGGEAAETLARFRVARGDLSVKA